MFIGEALQRPLLQFYHDHIHFDCVQPSVTAIYTEANIQEKKKERNETCSLLYMHAPIQEYIISAILLAKKKFRKHQTSGREKPMNKKGMEWSESSHSYLEFLYCAVL